MGREGEERTSDGLIVGGGNVRGSMCFSLFSSFLDSKKVEEIAKPGYRPSNQVCIPWFTVIS